MNAISNSNINSQMVTGKTAKRKVTKRKVRWNRVMLLAIFLMCCLSMTMNAFADTEPVYVPVIVSQGDTMWDLIKEHNPNYNGNMSEAVYETKLLNNTKDSGLYTGNQVLIPIFD